MSDEAVTIRNELQQKIAVLSERSIRIIHALADELLQQERTDADHEVSRQKKRQLLREMMEMREKSIYPADFDYKKVLEEALEEKYGRLA